MMDAVALQNVVKTFGRTTAVADLSLAVPKGSIYGFIGPNGAGKTTTLRMITGILYPDRGVIRVLGEPVQGACSDRVGYLPEERGLYKRMKVREILRFFGELKAVATPAPKRTGGWPNWAERLRRPQSRRAVQRDEPEGAVHRHGHRRAAVGPAGRAVQRAGPGQRGRAAADGARAAQ